MYLTDRISQGWTRAALRRNTVELPERCSGMPYLISLASGDRAWISKPLLRALQVSAWILARWASTSLAWNHYRTGSWPRLGADLQSPEHIAY